MSKTILIVDRDETLTRALVRQVNNLRPEGAEAHALNSMRDTFALLEESPRIAEEGVFLFAGGTIEVGKTGTELILKMRERLGDKLIGAVLMSGSPGRFQNDSREHGFEILEKPFGLKVLRTTLRPFIVLPEPPNT